MVSTAEVAVQQDPLSDEEVVARVLAGETAMFEIVVRRYNQRLYRIARAIRLERVRAVDDIRGATARGECVQHRTARGSEQRHAGGSVPADPERLACLRDGDCTAAGRQSGGGVRRDRGGGGLEQESD